MTTDARVSIAYPTLGRAYGVIAILWLITVFSQLDRQLPALLVGPMKASLDMSDTQFSLVQGYAFAIAYTLMGLPLGALVDRTNRRNLIIVGLGFWSVMTLLSGFAQSFGQLVFTRIGVGVGEAVLAPAAYSIIADYVAPERRGRALGLYYVSLAVGAGASLILGGMILGMLPEQGLVLPVLGTVQAWQATFLLAGLPGLPLMAVMLLVREPVRRETIRRERATIGKFLRYVRDHLGAVGRVITVTTLMSVVGYGAFAWAPAHFERSYGLKPSTAGPILGLIFAFTGIIAPLLGGWLGDRWQAQGRPAARFRVTAVAVTLVTPFSVIWTLMPTATQSFVLLTLFLFGLSLAQSTIPAAIQDVVPNQMRGQMVALYMLFAGLFGIGLGPTSIALVTDHVLQDEGGLRWAIALIAIPSSLIALWAAWSGQTPYGRMRLSRLTDTARQEEPPIVRKFQEEPA